MVRFTCDSFLKISTKQCVKIFNYKAIVNLSNTYYSNNVKGKKPNTHISFCRRVQITKNVSVTLRNSYRATPTLIFL